MRIKLYHYSNKELKRIEPRYFGDNSYTFNDVKASNVKRAFYYLDLKKAEYSLKACQYLYIAEADKASLYDLRTDKRGLVRAFTQYGIVNITKLLSYIKKDYIGVIYNIGQVDIACIFRALSVKKKGGLII